MRDSCNDFPKSWNWLQFCAVSFNFQTCLPGVTKIPIRNHEGKIWSKNHKTIIGGYFRNHPQDIAKNFYYSLWTLGLRQVFLGDYRFNSLAKSAVAGIPHGIEVGMSTHECSSLSESEGRTESLKKKQQVRWTKPKIWIINTATRNKHNMEGSMFFGGSLFAF